MIKKYISLLCVVCLLFTACKKEYDDYAFDQGPDERLTETLTKLSSQLTEAPNGWKVFIYPAGGRAYGYYMKFDKNNRVVMMGDFNNAQGATPKESSYRLKALQQPSLLFDTYNYLHVLADPDPSVAGGTAGKGLVSDFEFAYDPSKAQADTIRMFGRFNGSDFLLTKASAADASKYQAAAMQQLRDATQAFITANRYVVLELPDGTKKDLVMNMTTRAFGLSFLDGAALSVFNTSFAFTATGIYLKEPIVYKGKPYYELTWDDALKVYYIMMDSVRVNASGATTPIVPLYMKIGSAFTRLNIPPPSGLTGSSTDFATKYTQSKAALLASPYTLNLQNIDFVFNATAKTMILNVYFTQGTTLFVGVYNFNYTLTGDRLKFTYAGDGNGNATLAATYIAPLLNHIRNDNFNLNYFPSGSNVYGLMTSVENSGFYFTTNLF